MRKRTYGRTKEISTEDLKRTFSTLNYVRIALLFGSRARGSVTPGSDYDIAVLMDELPGHPWGMASRVRNDLEDLLGIRDYDLDVIDLSKADELIKSSIKEAYVVLKGENREVSGILDKTRSVAEEEQEVLDQLAGMLHKNNDLSKIEVRAAKNSLQVVIDNAIGLGKQILKQYDCPVVPARAKDVFYVLHETGAIDTGLFSELTSAVGFRNAMIHDYMNFDNNVLYTILQTGRYRQLVSFLIQKPAITKVVSRRIKNYSI